eukprot:symbB.v1.2.002252.t1/scaffold92.1/size545918/9
MGELLHLRSKPSRGRRGRERGDAGQSAFRGRTGGRRGSSSREARRERDSAEGVRPTDARVMPEIIGVSEASSAGVSGRWEFEVGSSFKPFDEDCQVEVEHLFQEYQRGGNRRAQVETRGMKISLDFKLMTSMVLGSKTVRQIRRV